MWEYWSSYSLLIEQVFSALFIPGEHSITMYIADYMEMVVIYWLENLLKMRSMHALIFSQQYTCSSHVDISHIVFCQWGGVSIHTRTKLGWFFVRVWIVNPPPPIDRNKCTFSKHHITLHGIIAFAIEVRDLCHKGGLSNTSRWIIILIQLESIISKGQFVAGWLIWQQHGNSHVVAR